MVWLVSHMWIALAGAALFGLLLGSSFRGLLLRGKARTATVERDVARTELEQAKAEIDGLYAAQRKRSEESGADAVARLQETLQSREAELNEAVAALSAVRAENDRLASEPAAPEAVQAPAPEIEEAPEAIVEPEPVSEEAETEEAESETAKLRWQVEYLKQRLAVLEAASEDTPTETQAEDGPSETEAETEDEELARLRWRNRYLEGRVAYLEGDADAVEGEPVQVAAAPDPAPHPPAEVASAPMPAPDVAAAPPIRLDSPHFGNGDDLTDIQGIGPKIEQVLKEDLGVFHYEQIAAWTAENIVWIEEALGFDGRISREAWVDQARALSETEAMDAS